MDYFLGAVITLLVISGVNFLYRRNKPDQIATVKYSQSHVYNLIGRFMPDNYEMTPIPDSQSRNYLDKIFIKVVFMDKKAYWIKDNTFYVADVINNQVQPDTAVEVDTMTMDKVQLDKIMTVVEKLTEGKNDNRNSR